MTPEHKLKLLMANLGRPLSKEHRENLSKARTGFQMSEETKRKIGEANKGQKSWNKGGTIPQEVKDKIATANKGKPSHLKGTKLSEEHKKKISASGRGRIGTNRGEKHPRWKGGITSTIMQIRGCLAYREWRQDCFIRDGFICQECGHRGSGLEVHHIKSFSDLIKEVKEYLPLFDLYDAAMIYSPLWDIDNGITLCKECHRGINNIYKKKKARKKAS